MFSQLRLIGYCIGGFAILMLALAWQVELRHAHKSDARIAELTQLRAADLASFKAAQAQAETQAQQNVQRVQSEQQRITSNVQSDYARQLADLRARFVRAPKADPGKPQGSAVPPGGTTPGGADDSARDGLSPPERQLAAEISLRLRALQDWVRQQSEVNPNTGAAPK